MPNVSVLRWAIFSFLGVVEEGGFVQRSSKCFKLKEGGWQEFATMKTKRASAAGIVFEEKLHIFGGTDGGRLNSTEIISANGVVIDGPNMPAAIDAHAITSINATVSIISGGIENYFITSQTWYYDHNTQVFSAGPTLLEGRLNHGSATIVDKETKANIPVVTGGFKSFGGSKLVSTELLINGEWKIGET